MHHEIMRKDKMLSSPNCFMQIVGVASGDVPKVLLERKVTLATHEEERLKALEQLQKFHQVSAKCCFNYHADGDESYLHDSM